MTPLSKFRMGPLQRGPPRKGGFPLGLPAIAFQKGGFPLGLFVIGRLCTCVPGTNAVQTSAGPLKCVGPYNCPNLPLKVSLLQPIILIFMHILDVFYK